jgi:hypothetical protein
MGVDNAMQPTYYTEASRKERERERDRKGVPRHSPVYSLGNVPVQYARGWQQGGLGGCGPQTVVVICWLTHLVA